jgi:1-deoxy-D-xylulose-5-phosphate reductoisomerase
MKVAILGSTGSIGISTLEVLEKHRDRYEVIALAAGNNEILLAKQIKKFKPRFAALADKDSAIRLKSLLGNQESLEILSGRDGMQIVATLPEVDIVVAAISGAAGLLPTISAVRAGKTVALANKESMVMAGELITEEAKKNNCKIIPVDSEHSAIFQLINGRNKNDVRNIILTASGGPFLNYTKEEIENAGPEDALKHPRWKMGNKVTIDSASLMNKGLEIIEAHWLFGLPGERIKVVIHPQSIIHSMVEFTDGTFFAQLSKPDMKGPIAYALSYPERLPDTLEPLDLTETGELTFIKPDLERFPSLGLAYRALEEGGLIPSVMNAANEVAVEEFYKRRIKFSSIPELIEKVMGRFRNSMIVNMENILWADDWARRESQKILDNMMKS